MEAITASSEHHVSGRLFPSVMETTRPSPLFAPPRDVPTTEGVLWVAGRAAAEFLLGFAEAWLYAYGRPPAPERSILYRRAVRRLAART